MPSLVVSLDIQAPLKASHKVGDLEEAWYAVRVHKEAGRAHSCKTCKTKIIKNIARIANAVQVTIRLLVSTSVY